MHSSLSPPNGFTLLEVLLYLGLFGVLMVNLVTVGFMVTDSARKSQTSWDTSAEADFIWHKLSWLLDNSRIVNPAAAGRSSELILSTNNGGDDITIALIDQHLQIRYSSDPPLILNGAIAKNLQLTLSNDYQLTFELTLNGQAFMFHKQLFVPP